MIAHMCINCLLKNSFPPPQIPKILIKRLGFMRICVRSGIWNIVSFWIQNLPVAAEKHKQAAGGSISRWKEAMVQLVTKKQMQTQASGTWEFSKYYFSCFKHNRTETFHKPQESRLCILLYLGNGAKYI